MPAGARRPRRRLSSRLREPRDLLTRLKRREVDRVGRTLAAERGLTWRPVGPGDPVEGTLAGSTRRAGGRFAMIDDGLRFSLVPWHDVLERQLGREVSGMARQGCGIEWTFGRQRGLGL